MLRNNGEGPNPLGRHHLVPSMRTTLTSHDASQRLNPSVELSHLHYSSISAKQLICTAVIRPAIDDDGADINRCSLMQHNIKTKRSHALLASTWLRRRTWAGGRRRPAQSSHRVTVRTDITARCTTSSWQMRQTDHSWVRRQRSMRSTVLALQRSSSSEIPPWRYGSTHFDTRGTSDTGFSRYMSDGATSLDTHREPVTALRRQRSVTVGHGSEAFSCRKDDSAPPILTAQASLPPNTP